MHVQCGVSRSVLVIAVAAAAVCLMPATVHAQSSTQFVSVTDAMLQRPAPEDWLMWRRTLDSWAYSPLDLSGL